ncbi:MAG: hypothetical protein RIR70_501 [Pseudomonadota bacterium]|jgi:competence protein ComEC
MRIVIIFFALGVLLCQWQAALPPAWVAPLLTLGGGLGVVVASLARHRAIRAGAWVFALMAGLGWAIWSAQTRLADELPHSSEGVDITLTGVVATLPQRYGSGVRFEFEVESANRPVPKRIWLSWYGGAGDEPEAALSPVRPGERWQLMARMKRPRGNMNPHGFDYEALLFDRGVRATGYVRQSTDNQRLQAFVWGAETLIERLRERTRDRIIRVLGEADFTGVVVALVVGDQRAIEQEFWTVFNRTGITHLMAISGFHITMIAALIGALAGFVWRRVPGLALRLPAQKFAIVAGWLAALLYCLIAGLGVPAQRTLCMLTVAALAFWFDRQVSASRVLCIALFVVLVGSPTAVMSAGFWLSFCAVAVLMFACGGALRPGQWWREALKSQWAVTIGLLPILLALFGQFSLVSPLANALAIPVVSLVVTPLALAGAFLPIDALLTLSHAVLAALMMPIEYLADLPWAVWSSHASPMWVVLLAMGGVLVLLMPRGMPMKWAGVVMLLPLFGVTPPRAAPGEAAVTVLDVGQGLSVHVQTAQHDLLFDTGPQFSPDANSGNRIIVPYLRGEGVRSLDMLVISHEDRDHSGGVHSVAEALDVRQVRDALSERSAWRPVGVEAAPCLAGQAWEWDGVRFEMLSPSARFDEAVRGNDQSCVLRVTAGGRRLLISADIEAPAEAALIARLGDDLRADFLIAPHHGSRTSSTPAFLEKVKPSVVIFPVGYRNRYRHPNGEVYARYQASGARLYRTDRDGALAFTLGQDQSVSAARDVHRRYWHDRYRTVY